MVSDSELVIRLREILRTSDLNTTSAGTVRRQLESDFGVDLSERKKFITQQIDEILASGDVNGAEEETVNQQLQEDENDGVEEHGEREEEEEEEEEGEEEDEEEEESDDHGNKKKRSKDEETTKKRKGGGFTKICSLSPQLQELVGVPEMARTEVVKNLWAYIREKDLQDPNNRRKIKCDKKLHDIFRVDTIDMFQMNKALSKHIWPLESEEVNSRPPEKKQKPQKEEDVENSKRKSNQKKGGATGFMIPLQLSEAFVKFLGTGETTLSRADAVKRIWDYIKQNQLQDPSDKRRILCDEKLKELFDVDSFIGFAVSKHLTAHLTKVEH